MNKKIIKSIAKKLTTKEIEYLDKEINKELRNTIKEFKDLVIKLILKTQ